MKKKHLLAPQKTRKTTFSKAFQILYVLSPEELSNSPKVQISQNKRKN
jgi:hypothetical protein